MLEIGSGHPLKGLTQTLYICILTSATAAITQKQLQKKKEKEKTEKDISLCNFFCKRKK